MEMTQEQAQELAELYPLAKCECGAVTLGGSDVVIVEGKTTFPEHTHDTYDDLLKLGGERLAPIVDLWQLSTNYEHPTPYVKFLDLIGYSEENFGTTLHEGVALGHLELGYIADAIKCWNVRPTDVENMIDTIERLAD
jgi:hypothetical protein